MPSFAATGNHVSPKRCSSARSLHTLVLIFVLTRLLRSRLFFRVFAQDFRLDRLIFFFILEVIWIKLENICGDVSRSESNENGGHTQSFLHLQLFLQLDLVGDLLVLFDEIQTL